MPKYILKRIVGTIPTLIIVVTFVFFFVRLIPGDPARLVAGEQATQDDVEAVREELGLEGIYAEALSRGVDIVLFGHTHRPVAEKRGNLWIVNPGSLTYPRQMGRKPSYAMLTINEEHELSVEIKYLD